MEDNRKYFDYDLAYKMYLKCKKLLAKGGIDELDEYFEEVGDRENGYTSYYGADYNAWVYIVNKNFDTDKQDESWLTSNGLYVSGEIDMISYGEGDDHLFINDKAQIEDRISKLLDYASKNDYSLEDIQKEMKSLQIVLTKLERGEESGN